MADEGEEVGPQENRPGGAKFKQQKLPAWKPVLTCRCVVPLFLAFGIAFIPLGSVFLIASKDVKELILDYTSCEPTSPVVVDDDTFSGPGGCEKLRKMRNETYTVTPCSCRVDFTLKEDWNDDVYYYYRLTEFYQNHRRYVRSINNEQLRGSLSQKKNCDPFKSDEGRGIAPCGAVANSLFNDTFELKQGGSNVDWVRRKISWAEDRDSKFKNPSGNLSEAFASYSKPVYWQHRASELSSDASNNGLLNEDFLVWMRIAALPKFRKLYARQPGGLKKGNYSLHINYNFPVSNGDKNFVISTTSWLGGKNDFLGIAYIVVGAVSLLMGGILSLVHCKYGKRKIYPSDTQ